MIALLWAAVATATPADALTTSASTAPDAAYLSSADWVLFGTILAASLAAGAAGGCLAADDDDTAVKGRAPTTAGQLGVSLRRRGPLTDVAFLITSYASVVLVMGKRTLLAPDNVCGENSASFLGLPTHAYFHGVSGQLFGGLPAALAALFAAVFLFLPLFSSERGPPAAATAAAVETVSWQRYLRLRFESSRAVAALFRFLVLTVWIVFAVSWLLHVLFSLSSPPP